MNFNTLQEIIHEMVYCRRKTIGKTKTLLQQFAGQSSLAIFSLPMVSKCF